MKTSTRTIYQCEFCGKVYLRKKWCEKHEYCCCKNPKNTTICYGCDHLEQQDDDESGIHVCTKKDSYVHRVAVTVYEPWKAEGSMEMPKECKDYKISDFPF